jgi:hypothetical protein
MAPLTGSAHGQHLALAFTASRREQLGWLSGAL